MKIGLITGLFVAFTQIAVAQVTDTLGYATFLEGTQTLYQSPNGGYAFGNNGYADLAKAQSYSHDQAFVLRKVLLLFGDVIFESADSASVVRVNVYDNNGPGITSLGISDSIAPDSVFAFVDVPVYQLLDNGDFSEVSFSNDTIVIRNRFSVGIDLTMLSPGDTVGLVSTSDGDALGTYSAWEQTSNGTWFTVEHPVYSWGLDVSLGIFPVIDADDPAGVPSIERHDLNIYPNPCTDELVVSNADLNSGVLLIHDATGRQVKQMAYRSASRVIDVSGLESGIYSMTIMDGGTRWSTKFIKTN